MATKPSRQRELRVKSSAKSGGRMFYRKRTRGRGEKRFERDSRARHQQEGWEHSPPRKQEERSHSS